MKKLLFLTFVMASITAMNGNNHDEEGNFCRFVLDRRSEIRDICLKKCKGDAFQCFLDRTDKFQKNTGPYFKRKFYTECQGKEFNETYDSNATYEEPVIDPAFHVCVYKKERAYTRGLFHIVDAVTYFEKLKKYNPK